MLELIVGGKQTHTFLLGECMTGAGGDGGPRGIFLLILLENTNIEFPHTLYSISLKSHIKVTYLNRGGSIGSFCISTIRMTLCFAPELNASPCWEGVYL